MANLSAFALSNEDKTTSGASFSRTNVDDILVNPPAYVNEEVLDIRMLLFVLLLEDLA